MFPIRGCPIRAELLDVNINTGTQSINTERAALKAYIVHKLGGFHESTTRRLQFTSCGQLSELKCLTFSAAVRLLLTYDATEKVTMQCLLTSVQWKGVASQHEPCRLLSDTTQ